MKTTPCGLSLFETIDTYNFSDMERNFKRPDELLARFGAHSSRFFDYNGVDKIKTVGAKLDPRFTANSFRLLGKGEWFYFSIDVTVKNDIPKNGSKQIIGLPEFYSAMHTQKLSSVVSGRGVGGWISQAGQVNAGTFSGSDATLKAEERLQLAGWYLPTNNLKTIGISNIRESSPFYSEYVAMLNSVDTACSQVNASSQVFTKEQNAIIRGNDARLSDDSEVFFKVSSPFKLHSGGYSRLGDFSYIRIRVSLNSGTMNVGPTGDITNAVIGTIQPNKFEMEPIFTQPLENGNTGRIIYPYLDVNRNIGIASIGRAGGTDTQTLRAGEEFEVCGIYRIKGS